MKKLLMSLVAISSVVWFVGCSKSDGGGGALGVSCPSGSSYNGSYCIDANGNTVNPVGPTSTVQYYDYNWYQVYTQYRGDLTIVNSAAYKAFLKEALGVCDTQVWTLFPNIGYANCNAWTGGSLSIAWAMDSALKPSISFTAYPTPQYFSASFGINGNGAALNPLNLYSATTYNLINNSKGFEIRSNGSSWNGGGLRLIQIQVPVGTLADNYFAYDVYYPLNGVATKFASGKFKRY